MVADLKEVEGGEEYAFHHGMHLEGIVVALLDNVGESN
jgi:hypothetical protein